MLPIRVAKNKASAESGVRPSLPREMVTMFKKMRMKKSGSPIKSGKSNPRQPILVNYSLSSLLGATLAR